MDAPAAWVRRFHTHLASERRLSPHTVSAYGRELAAFAQWCNQQGYDDWARIDAAQLRSYAARSHAGGLNPRSVQRRLSALRTFYEFLIREGLATHNPAVGVRAPKAGRRLPHTLDVDQMARLLALKPEGALPTRDLAIMELFYSSGLRLAELIGLDLFDLDLKDRTVRVLGKGSKTRIMPVGRQAVSALQQWLKERSVLAAAGENAVFLNRRGRRLGARSVQLLVARHARALQDSLRHARSAAGRPTNASGCSSINRRKARGGSVRRACIWKLRRCTPSIGGRRTRSSWR